MGKMYEQNIANEARTIATMLDWSSNKNDSTIAKLAKLLRELAMVIEDKMSAMRHYEEHIEFLKKKLDESEKARYEKVETV